jgi:nucleotide-binding universal stress UspA family protein
MGAMLEHILVPLDGSKLAEKAIDYGRQILKTGGKITLLTVLDIPEYPIYGFYPTPVIMEEGDYQTAVKNLTPKAREYLESIASLLRVDGFDVRILAEIGEPGAVIIDTAQKLKVDAIVMSTHGRSGFSRWLFGSVTNKVLSAALCPVFVVPGAQKQKSVADKESEEAVIAQ